ncbi:hypothetical protein BX611_1907 [Lutibacter oceani]|uniref:Curlin associated repeat-containing protein n=1 Tax=Lutibacter oceani TaxID=1853311 RepID=A0A3D9RKI4_9FLAO|nr:hypothetical protein [Lutibacter oceani]REE80267.1 hypothetical protein BX611_1907 [Lutibacter oceani]
MKTTYKILFVCLLSFFSVKLYAQITDENTFIIHQYFKNTITEKAPIIYNDLKIEAALNYSISKNKLLNISQIGTNNYINVKANSNIQNINQIGNHNNYEFISYYGKKDSNFEIQQYGNYNLIQVLGENTIINNLKIVQRSDFKTITITNY